LAAVDLHHVADQVEDALGLGAERAAQDLFGHTQGQRYERLAGFGFDIGQRFGAGLGELVQGFGLGAGGFQPFGAAFREAGLAAFFQALFMPFLVTGLMALGVAGGVALGMAA